MICRLRYEQVRDRQYICLRKANRKRARRLLIYCSHLRATGTRACITCMTWREVALVWILYHVESMLMLLLMKGWTVTWALKHFGECLLLLKRWTAWQKWRVHCASYGSSYGWQPHFEAVDCFDLIALKLLPIILTTSRFLRNWWAKDVWDGSALQVT